MTVTVRIRRSEGQWVATVPRARSLFAWSPSLQRVRGHVDAGLKRFFPKLAKQPRREVIELPADSRALLKRLARAEKQAQRATNRAVKLRRATTQRLRAKLGLSIREVGEVMGISGSRAQQLLERR